MLIMYVRLLKNKDHLSTVRIKSINMSSESLNTLRQLYNNELGILLWRRFHTCTCILVVLYRSVILKRGNERPKKIRSTVLYAFLQHFEICIWLCGPKNIPADLITCATLHVCFILLKFWFWLKFYKLV